MCKRESSKISEFSTPPAHAAEKLATCPRPPCCCSLLTFFGCCCCFCCCCCDLFLSSLLQGLLPARSSHPHPPPIAIRWHSPQKVTSSLWVFLALRLPLPPSTPPQRHFHLSNQNMLLTSRAKQLASLLSSVQLWLGYRPACRSVCSLVCLLGMRAVSFVFMYPFALPRPGRPLRHCSVWVVRKTPKTMHFTAFVRHVCGRACAGVCVCAAMCIYLKAF